MNIMIRKNVNKALMANAFHEAGHAVMAYVLRMPITKVTIKETDKYSGLTTMKNILRDKNLDDYTYPNFIDLEKEVLCSLAGYYAERSCPEKRTKKYDTQEDYGDLAQEDYRDVIDLISIITLDSKRIEKIIKLFEFKCDMIINCSDISAAIEELANLLYDKETISGKEAKNCIKNSLEIMRMDDAELRKQMFEGK